jgi:ribosome-binding factor A
MAKKAKRGADMAAGPSQRMLRIGEMIRHKVSEMLMRAEIHDAVISSAVITVPEVRMSPDLKLATIFIMPLGGKDLPKVLAALEANKKYIRGEVARTLNLKFAPDVRFKADETFDEAARIDKLFRDPKVRQDVEKDK